MVVPEHLLDLEQLSWERYTQLRRLLPIELQQQLDQPHAVSSAVKAQVHQHLARLLGALQATVPRWLLGQLLQPERSQRLALGGEATLLFADVTGFSSLTKLFAEESPEGNEPIVELLNRFFVAMVGITYHWGGDVLAFGGDALLVAFHGNQHQLRAAAAACAMRTRIDELEPITLPNKELQRLRMKIGIASGPLVCVAAGSPSRRVPLALGHVLATTNAMAHTPPDTIRLDPEAAAALLAAVRQGGQRPEEYLDFQTPTAGSALLLRPPAVAAPPELSERNLHAIRLSALVERVVELAPYLPRDLLGELSALASASNDNGLQQGTGATPGSGEQRSVVSCFFLLKGLHVMADALGPTRMGEVAEVADLVLGRCIEIIEDAGGTLARVDTYDDGHKLLVLFGAPQAQAGDTEWAVRCALELLRELPAIQQRLDGVGRTREVAGSNTASAAPVLSLHAGVNASQVLATLAGSPVRFEYTVTGDSVNTGARLMGLAAEHAREEVLVGASVFALLRHKLADVKAETHSLKNVGSMLVYPVGKLREAEAPAPSKPFYGRTAELEAVRTDITAFAGGQRRLVLIQGELGVGKTRLLQEMLQELRDSLGTQASAIFVTSQGRALPRYAGIRSLIRGLCDAPPDAGTELLSMHLDRVLAAHGLGQEAALLTALRFLVGASAVAPAIFGDSVADQHRGLAQQVQRLIRAVARQRPLALFCEDLHTFDGESLALLEQLMLLGWPDRLFFCATARPQRARSSVEQPALQQLLHTADNLLRDDLRPIMLLALDQAACLALLNELLPGIAHEAAQRIYNFVSGNPLLLEGVAEYVRQQNLLVESLTGKRVLRGELAALGVPATMRELAVAQLTAIAPEVRQLASIAAVVASGTPRFRFGTLVQLVGERSTVDVRLRELQRARIIDADPSGPPWSFVFHHVLFQNEAYRLLLVRERRKWHRRASEVLDDPRHADFDTHVEALAHHCYEAQQWDRALEYALAAGQRARRSYANERALHHLERALTLAQRLGQPRRVAQAHESLGALHAMTGAFAPAREQLQAALDFDATVDASAAQLEARIRRHRWLALVAERTARTRDDDLAAEQICRAGLDLCARLAHPTIEAARLHALRAEILMRIKEDVQAERACAEGLDALPRNERARREQALLLWRQATLRSKRGDYAEAIPAFEQSLVLLHADDPQGETDKALRAGMLDNLGVALERVGRIDEAFQRYEECIAIQEAIGDVAGIVRALGNLGSGPYLLRGHYERALELLERSRMLSERHGMSEPEARANLNLGIIKLMQRNLEAARQQLQSTLEAFRSLGYPVEEVDCLYRLSDVALAAGDYEQAYAEADLVRRKAHELAEPAFETCALRVMGEARTYQGFLAQAQQLLQAAQAIQDQTQDAFDAGLLFAARARLALARGDRAAALALLDEGVAVVSPYGYAYPLALLAEVRAELLGV